MTIQIQTNQIPSMKTFLKMLIKKYLTTENFSLNELQKVVVNLINKNMIGNYKGKYLL